MKNKLLVLFAIFGLNANSNCSEVNNNGNRCIDQNNNVINCLYYSTCENKYYKIDENNEKQLYLLKNGDIILDLFSNHNGGFYAYDKNGIEYNYSPNNFKSIQSDKFDLRVVYKCNNIITLNKYFCINVNSIRDSFMLNNNIISSTKYDTNTGSTINDTISA